MPFGNQKQLARLAKRIEKNSTAKWKAATVKAKVNKVAKAVKALNPEFKFSTTNISQQIQTNNWLPVTANNNLKQLFIIPQGDTQNNRQGSKITAKYMDIRYELLNTGGAALPAFVRVMVVYDKRPNQAFPPTPDFLYDAGPGAPLSTFNMRNQNYMKRFVVLMNNYHRIGTLGTVTTDYTGGNLPALILHQKRIKLRDKVTQYIQSSAVGDMPEITDGAYYLITFSTVEPGGVNNIQISGLARMFFTDV